MCRIIIVESYSLFGAGLKHMLSRQKGFNIIREVHDVDELIKLSDKEDPDILIIDIHPSKDAGIKSLKKIKTHFKKSSILLITHKDLIPYFEEYISIGVKGIIFKDSNEKELIKAITKIENGEEYFRKNVLLMLKTSIQNHSSTSNIKKLKGILTQRESSVLKLFCDGHTYKEIGSKLFISPRTVETHKRNILKKLNLHSIAEMVRYAYHNHIIV